MKIVICGSMSSAGKMIEIKKNLESAGHEIVLPRNTEDYAIGHIKMENSRESTENKIKHDLIRSYFKEIDKSDAVLIINIDKNGIENYLGGNSFLELAFGYVLKKKLYLLNLIPDVLYRDEIKAMQPIILNGNLARIKNDSN